MALSAHTSLGELVAEDSRRSRILETFGLDYCCHGARTLTEAVDAAGLELDAVIAALDLPDTGERAAATGIAGDNAALAHDIVDTHHAYMWAEMPRLGDLIDTIHRVHGERHPELAQVRDLYRTMATELDPHMTREERSVFPAISALEKGQQPRRADDLGAAIDQLVDEHEAVGELLRELRQVTNGYEVPEDGCHSYRMAYEGLAEMEHDLHVHIHKENNILFPAARAMAD